MSYESVELKDGLLVRGSCTDEDVFQAVRKYCDGENVMIITDPPYGNILKDSWDKKPRASEYSEWLVSMTRQWSELLPDGGAFYIWGGVGSYCDRPFFLYAAAVESETDMKIQNVITWSKRRGFGTVYNYLFTREELLFMIKGKKSSKPSIFNIPLLDEERGYPGFNKKYPAKSKYKRRTNVWSDVTEIFRGKLHSAEKAQGVLRVPIETSSNEGDMVVDMFGGSGSTGVAARSLGRRFVLIEKDEGTFRLMVRRLSEKS